MTIKSTHIICDFKYKGNMGNIYQKLKKAINIGKLTIVDECVHHFNPYGVSIIFILAESHISIHTWEEENTINVDLFICGDNDPYLTLNEFLSQFEITSKQEQIIKRNNI